MSLDPDYIQANRHTTQAYTILGCLLDFHPDTAESNKANIRDLVAARKEIGDALYAMNYGES